MEAIKYYVKGAFQGVDETPQVLEQQEELIADLTAKVADLVAEGKSQEEALGMAIASVGDLSDLISEFGPAENMPVPIPVATVYANRLDLHVVTVSLGIGMAVMIACTGLGAKGRPSSSQSTRCSVSGRGMRTRGSTRRSRPSA